MDNKLYYLHTAKTGQLVAFWRGGKAISGKIKKRVKEGFIIVTKNGTVYNIPFADVMWVKTDRWPKGVYLALKGVAQRNV